MNLESDEAVRDGVRAGASRRARRRSRTPAPAVFDGLSGYFADPDGHCGRWPTTAFPAGPGRHDHHPGRLGTPGGRGSLGTMSENEGYADGEYSTEGDDQIQPGTAWTTAAWTTSWTRATRLRRSGPCWRSSATPPREEREGEIPRRAPRRGGARPGAGDRRGRRAETPLGQRRRPRPRRDHRRPAARRRRTTARSATSAPGGWSARTRARTATGEKDQVAGDVGIDGGAASAEEAAVHIVDEE